jgi:hypothetical protein
MARNPALALARLLGCTEGQAYTLVIGLVIATALAVTGVPAVLRSHPVNVAVSRSPLLFSPGPGSGTAVPTGVQRDSSPAAPLGSPSQAPPSQAMPSLFTPSPADIPLSAPAATPSAGPPAGSGIGGTGTGGSSPPASPQPAAAAPVTEPAPGTISLFARVGAPGAPGGLAAGPDGTVYVTTDNGTGSGDPGPSHVFSFDAQGALVANRTVAGQVAGHADGLTGAAVDPRTGDVVVVDPDDARILSIDMASGAQTVMARVPDLPACLISLGADPCEPGAEDHKPFPVAAAFDRQGDLFITDPAQDTIWRLPPSASAPEVWYQSDDFATGDGPYGLALDRGSVEFTVGTTLSPSDLDAGGLYRVAINPDGSAGTGTLVTAFAQGDEPGPLAVGSSGTAYVALRRTGSIALIAPNGSQTGEIDPPGNSPVPLDSPSALALVPGALLVANEGSTGGAAHWAVLAVSERDGPQQ